MDIRNASEELYYFTHKILWLEKMKLLPISWDVLQYFHHKLFTNELHALDLPFTSRKYFENKEFDAIIIRLLSIFAQNLYYQNLDKMYYYRWHICLRLWTETELYKLQDVERFRVLKSRDLQKQKYLYTRTLKMKKSFLRKQKLCS